MKYNSHIKSLKIVIRPAMPVYEGGIKVNDKPGKYALFVDGQFETQDEEIIAKLESLSTFGVDFWKVDGTAPESNQQDADKDEEQGLEKHTKKELQVMAEERGIELDGSENKDDIIGLIEEHDNAEREY